MKTDQFLKNQRKQIDQVDKKIIQLLGKRLAIVKKIGQYKKQHQLPFLDQKRFQALIEKNCRLGEKVGLEKEFVKKLYQLIHQLSLKVEKSL